MDIVHKRLRRDVNVDWRVPIRYNIHETSAKPTREKWVGSEGKIQVWGIVNQEEILIKIEVNYKDTVSKYDTLTGSNSKFRKEQSNSKASFHANKIVKLKERTWPLKVRKNP